MQACREIFQNQMTASKDQRILVEQVCNDNNTNLKVLNCVKHFNDLTPINNSKQCKQKKKCNNVPNRDKNPSVITLLFSHFRPTMLRTFTIGCVSDNL